MATSNAPAPLSRMTGWIPYAGLLVLFWGVWGAFSSLPTKWYGYPDPMVYVVWALTMILPAWISLRGKRFDRGRVAAGYGLLIGLTGAGGQLLLFKALTIGPAYIIFPIIALSPAITVLLAFGALRERLGALSWTGVVLALAAVVLFSVSPGDGGDAGWLYLVLAVLVCVAWGVQAFFMRKAAVAGVADETTFGWMTISGLLLIPVAIVMMGGLPLDFPWQAPALTAVTQLLNAVGALFLVMAMSRGKASIVAPVTNALAPVLTIVLSLVVFGASPTGFQLAGIVLALVGSTLMVYRSEKSAEAEGVDVARAD
ncbi:DMT family transporter [Umezawaea endophytica]|uniref:DMT family transporter n=1 Tax=Umezawaea endophytica TaxID=1654476 RepID=A0A9X2VQ08_9PSEU|nr:DMT family transporter [Umezawaea endophytica]MCS7480499.1 DMT family transporter [Umezawaea endophytica]